MLHENFVQGHFKRKFILFTIHNSRKLDLRNEFNSYQSHTRITWVGTAYGFYKPLRGILPKPMLYSYNFGCY